MKIGKINKVGCWSTSKLVIANLRNLHKACVYNGPGGSLSPSLQKKNLQHFITQITLVECHQTYDTQYIAGICVRLILSFLVGGSVLVEIFVFCHLSKYFFLVLWACLTNQTWNLSNLIWAFCLLFFTESFDTVRSSIFLFHCFLQTFC